MIYIVYDERNSVLELKKFENIKANLHLVERNLPLFSRVMCNDMKN
jgi:hypothetical protein